MFKTISFFLQKQKLFVGTIIFSLIFLTALSFNLSPFLRGPAPYPPDWRWSYVFVNTFSRLWAPVVVGLMLLILGWFSLAKKLSSRIKVIYLFVFIFLMFLFEIALLYYSRSGIFVLLHRIINPDLNGYFTASIAIKNPVQFLNSYNSLVLHLPMHATGHPPGAIFFFTLLRFFASLLPFPKALLLHSPMHTDVKVFWDHLSLLDRYTAVMASLLIPFLSTTVILPVFILARYLYNERTGFFAVLLYALTPSVSLFIPINDTILALFSVTSIFLFLKGLGNSNFISRHSGEAELVEADSRISNRDKRSWMRLHFVSTYQDDVGKKRLVFIFFAGVVFSLGLFMSTSLLPLIVMFVVLAFKDGILRKSITLLTHFCLGFLLIPSLLFLFTGFNFFQVALTLMTGLPKSRHYLTWLFYNPYAFFLFAGLPTLPYFTVGVKDQVKLLVKNKLRKLDSFLLAFGLMIILLILSGAVRGEVERIWLPLMPFLAIIVAHVISDRYKVGKKMVMALAAVFLVQIIIFQTFLVTLW